MQKFYTDRDGKYLGSYDDSGTGIPHPFGDGAIEHNEMPIVEKSYIDKRVEEYGSVKYQIEFAVENGFQALVDRNLAIKQKYPKN